MPYIDPYILQPTAGHTILGPTKYSDIRYDLFKFQNNLMSWLTASTDTHRPTLLVSRARTDFGGRVFLRMDCDSGAIFVGRFRQSPTDDVSDLTSILNLM